MPAPRSTIRRHCAASSPPSVSAATSPVASFSLSGSSSMSRTDDAHGASSGEPARDQDHRAGNALAWPGAPAGRRLSGRPSGGPRPTPSVGVDAAVWASQATRAWSVCWRSARASTSGRDHRSSVSSPSSGANNGTASRSRPASVQPGLQFGEPFLRRLARVEPEQLLEHAPDRPQRDVAVIRRALGLEHDTAFDAHVRRELRRQRRLPDAGHPADDDHRLRRDAPRLGVVDEPLPGEAEEAALALAADQGHRLGQPATRAAARPGSTAPRGAAPSGGRSP